jgi:hypothetical protein
MVEQAFKLYVRLYASVPKVLAPAAEAELFSQLVNCTAEAVLHPLV